MANMVYCTMEVEAPNQEKLMEFISNQTSADKGDIALGGEFVLYFSDEKTGPAVTDFLVKDNKITLQFQTKWSPPADEIKAIVKKYKDLIIDVDAYEEFNHFSYKLSSGPNHFNENFKKTSIEEIRDYDNKLSEFNKLIQSLSNLPDDTYNDILENVAFYRSHNKEIEEKYTFIKENINKIHGQALEDIYKMVKNPYPKKIIDFEIEIDDDEDWM